MARKDLADVFTLSSTKTYSFLKLP